MRRSPTVIAAGAAGTAAQQGADPGDEDRERERLGEEVVGAGVERLGLVELAVLGREDEDRRPHAGIAQVGAHLEAVAARQHQVEDDEVVATLERQPTPFQPVGGDLDGEPLGAQPALDGAGDLAVVLDEQHLHAASSVDSLAWPAERQLNGTADGALRYVRTSPARADDAQRRRIHDISHRSQGRRMTSAGGAVLPEPALLWTPGPDARNTSRVGRYMDWLQRERGVAVADFAALHTWSVTALEDFWQSLWDYFGITSSAPPTAVLSERTMPGARWFTGARLNYAEHIVGGRFAADDVAVVARSQTRAPITLTFGELAAAVGRARAGLQRLAIGPGDRVVGYLPNIPETLVAFLATASLGATWATCPPEFGERSVIDRFGQLEPAVLFTVAGYRYGDTDIDRSGNVASIAGALPSLRHVVEVPYGATRLGTTAVVPPLVSWDELVADDGDLDFLQVPFDHPLCVLFSSGTTGLPKAIIHGHGGLLLEHLKNHALSWDLGPGDRLMWFTTTAWMMWNALVSTLLTGASIVMLDGNPLHPDAAEQWRLAAAVGATMLGVSPSYLSACRKAGVEPRDDRPGYGCARCARPAPRCLRTRPRGSTNSSATTRC